MERLLKSKSTQQILSLVLVLLSLFAVALLHMEVTRLGYQTSRLSQQLLVTKDNYRLKYAGFQKLAAPEHIQRVAKHELSLSKASPRQVIHMDLNGVALHQ